MWSLLSASDAAGKASGCNRIVLFLTDGEPNSWGSSDYADVASQAAAQGARLPSNPRRRLRQRWL